MEKKYYLTLTDDFIQYCKLNNIDDVEKKGMEVFNNGFNILKYGTLPMTKKNDEVIKPTNNKKDSLYDW